MADEAPKELNNPGAVPAPPRTDNATAESFTSQGQAWNLEGMTIAERVALAAGEIETVLRDQERKDRGYNYAGTDAIFKRARPMLARYGLDLRHTFVKIDIVNLNKVDYLDMHMRAWFACPSPRLTREGNNAFQVAANRGEWEEAPSDAFLMLRWLGPESYEGGGSRLMKGWLRRRLLIDTGEEDSQEGEEEKDTGKPDRQAQAAAQQRQQHAATVAATAGGDRGGMGSRKPGRCRTAHLCPVLQGPARAFQERHVSMKQFGIQNAYMGQGKGGVQRHAERLAAYNQGIAGGYRQDAVRC